MPDEGFLRRWARRKAERRPPENRPAETHRAEHDPAAPLADPALHAAAPLPGASALAASGPAASPVRLDAGPPATAVSPPAHDAGKEIAPTGRASPAAAHLPTLDDAAQLTPDSDFSAFVARGVDAAVRRTALKKLFADPHFNAMDGLDVYIGDYTQPSPVSDTMLASLAHARQVLRRAVNADEGSDEADAPDAATHLQRQQPPEPGHDEYPPDRRTDDA